MGNSTEVLYHQEQQEKDSVCFKCQYMPGINQQICTPILVMLGFGRKIGIDINEICFGVCECQYYKCRSEVN